MVLFKFGIPVLAILGFGHAVYEVFSGKEDGQKMGLASNIIKMFAVANLFMTICWALIIVGLASGAGWPRSLAIFITGMYFFDYVVSLASYKNAGDRLFKYWGGAGAVLLILYCAWL